MKDMIEQCSTMPYVLVETSARDELMKIEISNDCCTTLHPTWTNGYSQAAECNRDDRHRLIYADQDEQRACVKIISRTALSLLPVLVSEILCGCLCLLLGLWTTHLTYHIHRQNNDELRSMSNTDVPSKHVHRPSMNNVEPNLSTNNDRTTIPVDVYSQHRLSYPSASFRHSNKLAHVNTMLT
jgi:hypothetical protein